MGRATRIDWCDATWNPVTGCLHGCEYCYASRIAERFKGGFDFIAHGEAKPLCWVVENPGIMNDGRKAVYPFGFDPTFHRYRLDEPQHWKKPRNIFVCSMADIFGDWVPDEWIKEVFKACEAAPQHRYLFLTKNPKRYYSLIGKGILADNGTDMRFGFTMDGVYAPTRPIPKGFGTFTSIEPLRARLTQTELNDATATEWVIIGAETGNRKGKVVPDKNWVYDIVEACREEDVPIFMKESLRDLMGSDFRQDFPWEEY